MHSKIFSILSSVATVQAAVLLAVCLTSCNNSDSNTESSGTGDNTNSATSDPQNDAYADLENFDHSALFDDNGYVEGVTALDYVTLPEWYAEPELPAGTDTVSEERVDSLIKDDVLYYYAETEQITDREAKMGDTVNIDYIGTVDGVAFEGGDTKGSGTTLTLTGENYIDDFEEQIAGHKPGETFDVNVTFPDPYSANPDLSGKDAVFSTTINYISEMKYPELTDDFVEENLSESTGCHTVTEVKTYYRDQLVYNQELNALYELLDENTTYAAKLPEKITKYYQDLTLYSAYQMATMYSMNLEDLLSQSGYDSVEQYLEDMQETIQSSVNRVLMVQAMAEKLGITCDTKTLNKNFTETFYGADIDTYRETYGEEYLKMVLLQDMTLKKIIENATIAK